MIKWGYTIWRGDVILCSSIDAGMYYDTKDEAKGYAEHDTKMIAKTLSGVEYQLYKIDGIDDEKEWYENEETWEEPTSTKEFDPPLYPSWMATGAPDGWEDGWEDGWNDGWDDDPIEREEGWTTIF